MPHKRNTAGDIESYCDVNLFSCLLKNVHIFQIPYFCLKFIEGILLKDDAETRPVTECGILLEDFTTFTTFW